MMSYKRIKSKISKITRTTDSYSYQAISNLDDAHDVETESSSFIPQQETTQPKEKEKEDFSFFHIHQLITEIAQQQKENEVIDVTQRIVTENGIDYLVAKPNQKFKFKSNSFSDAGLTRSVLTWIGLCGEHLRSIFDYLRNPKTEFLTKEQWFKELAKRVQAFNDFIYITEISNLLTDAQKNSPENPMRELIEKLYQFTSTYYCNYSSLEECKTKYQQLLDDYKNEDVLVAYENFLMKELTDKFILTDEPIMPILLPRDSAQTCISKLNEFHHQLFKYGFSKQGANLLNEKNPISKTMESIEREIISFKLAIRNNWSAFKIEEIKCHFNEDFQKLYSSAMAEYYELEKKVGGNLHPDSETFFYQCTRKNYNSVVLDYLDARKKISPIPRYKSTDERFMEELKKSFKGLTSAFAHLEATVKLSKQFAAQIAAKKSAPFSELFKNALTCVICCLHAIAAERNHTDEKVETNTNMNGPGKK